MPEMGGFEATRGDSAREAATGRARADRRADRARDAGRSRALPRRRHGRLPAEADRRRRADRHRRDAAPRSAAAAGGRARQPSRPTPARRPSFDEAAALAHTGGDRRLLTRDRRALSRRLRPALCDEIGRRIDRRDGEALRTRRARAQGSMATSGRRAGREAATARSSRWAARREFDGATRGVATLR